MNTKVSKNTIKDSIYNAISAMTSRIYKDDDWQAVNNVLGEIRYVLSSISTKFTLNVSVKDGGYHSSDDGTSQWKEYILEVEDGDGRQVLSGILNAHAAGTVSDPFERYDISVILS